MTSKNQNFRKSYNINAIKIASKEAIAEDASMSGGRDILYSYVATENDHTVFFNSKFLILGKTVRFVFVYEEEYGAEEEELEEKEKKQKGEREEEGEENREEKREICICP